MNVDEYVTARYGRLLERAVELGAEEGLASEYVDQVLLDQQRAIRKAEDPDPVVYAALERAVLKIPEPGRSPWPLVAVGLVGVGLLVGITLTRDPGTEPMPALFGSTGEQAERLLTGEGWDVMLRPMRVCEPMGMVVRSDPLAGEPVPAGATVSVFTAVTSGSHCEAEYPQREDAWEFLDFAITGDSTPPFAGTVIVYIDGVEGEPRSGVDAVTSARWTALRELVADQAAVPAETSTGLPVLTVTAGVPPATTCGHGRPAGAAERTALRLVVDARAPEEDRGCPLVIDLYRDSRGVIDGVVIYTAVDPP